MGFEQADELLAVRAARGDLSAFEEIVRRHRSRAYAICYRMAGNGADADDWAQECFVRLYRQLGRYDPAMPFLPWLLRVVSNACVNLAKARSRHRAWLAPEPVDDVMADDADPLSRAVSAEDARRARAAVASLPPLLRQAIVLRLVEGLSYREIAEVLGTPLPTAAARVRRGLEAARAALARTEKGVSAWGARG